MMRRERRRRRKKFANSVHPRALGRLIGISIIYPRTISSPSSHLLSPCTTPKLLGSMRRFPFGP